MKKSSWHKKIYSRLCVMMSFRCIIDALTMVLILFLCHKIDVRLALDIQSLEIMTSKSFSAS